jgi:hypothetical protein
MNDAKVDDNLRLLQDKYGKEYLHNLTDTEFYALYKQHISTIWMGLVIYREISFMFSLRYYLNLLKHLNKLYIYSQFSINNQYIMGLLL